MLRTHLFSLALLAGHVRLAGAQAAVRHPDPRYIRAPAVAGFTASLTDRASPLPLRLGSVLGSFGTESDPENMLLGDIGAAGLLPAGGIVVLDDKLIRLRVFGANAQPLQSLGREGGGPGEFARGVRALSVDTGGRILVSDLSRGLKVFAPAKDGYRYTTWIPLGFSPQAMCVSGATIVGVGLQAGRPEVLHTFAGSGTRLGDFGLVYVSPNLGLNDQYNRGPVVCDPVRPVVYFAVGGGFGDVRAYQTAGTPLWRTTINGFKVNIVEEIPRGYSVRASPDGVHRVQSLVLIPGIGLLLQIGHATPKDLEDESRFSTLTSFLIDPSTGRPTPLGTSLPRILAADASRVLVATDDPVPHFEIRAWTAP